MKLEVGMYVRTKRKGIVKIDEIIDNGVITYEDDLGREWEEETGRKVIRYIGKDGWNSGLDEKEILKASYNIIDILEIGDILVDDTNRKLEILLIDNELMVRNAGLIYDNNYYIPIKSIAIKSVITHEQMEQMAYKVGDK